MVCVYDDREHAPETYNPEYNITTLPENSYRCVKFWCVNIRPGKPETYDDLETCNTEYNFPEKFYRCGKFWCVYMTTGCGKSWCVYMTTGNPESYDDPIYKIWNAILRKNPTTVENCGVCIRRPRACSGNIQSGIQHYRKIHTAA